MEQAVSRITKLDLELWKKDPIDLLHYIMISPSKSSTIMYAAPLQGLEGR